MENTIETIEYRNYTISIVQDTEPFSPREEDCNLGNMICFHNNYNLGDTHNYTIEGLKQYISRKDIISLPLYLYDHSGISISTSNSYPFDDKWDAGQIGFILISKERICLQYNVKRITAQTLRRVYKCLEQEVEIYNDYLTGNVYGYCITDNSGNDTNMSCYGFFGDYNDYMVSECKSDIDYHIDYNRRAHYGQLKQWIKNNVPLQYRKPCTI